MEEIWHSTNYNYIEVSNLGNVRAKDMIRDFLFYDRHNKTYKKTKRLVKSHYMSIQHNNRGYCFVCYQEKARRKNLLVHRLVAEAFLPNPEHKLEVNHIDGNPQNNAVSNLEWVTASENKKHAYWVLNCPCFGKRHK